MKHLFEDIAREASEMFEISSAGATDEMERGDCDMVLVEALLQYAQASLNLMREANKRAEEKA